MNQLSICFDKSVRSKFILWHEFFKILIYLQGCQIWRFSAKVALSKLRWRPKIWLWRWAPNGALRAGMALIMALWQLGWRIFVNFGTFYLIKPKKCGAFQFKTVGTIAVLALTEVRRFGQWNLAIHFESEWPNFIGQCLAF